MNFPDALDMKNSTMKTKEELYSVEAARHLEMILGGITQASKAGRFEYGGYSVPQDKDVADKIKIFLLSRHYKVSIWEMENGPDKFAISWK